VATSTGHGHDRRPIVAHHFNNIRQQQATVRMGMWLFLVTEVLFFGGVFVAYTAYRLWYPREFEAGSTALNPWIAGVNSFLLLGSSFTALLGVRAAYAGNRKGLQLWLAVTILLGLGFLAFKAREYSVDISEGLVPSPRTVTVVEDDEHGRPVKKTVTEFSQHLGHALREKEYYQKDGGKHLAEVNLDRAQLFFVFYYTMTGLHVIHMIVGIGLFIWQFVLASNGFFDYPERYVYVEALSLYWHFVELVWIFLLPLLYMAGHHSAAHPHF
jgi:cytochrome c oxidase subunit 3